MADLSQLSTEQLKAMLGQSDPAIQPVDPSKPISNLNELLANAALRQDTTPQQYEAIVNKTPLDLSTFSTEQLQQELAKISPPAAPLAPQEPKKQSLIEQLGSSQFSKDVNKEVSESAKHGIGLISQFGSTEPTYQAESALGQFAANASRPFRPVVGAAELALAPLTATLSNVVGKPIVNATGSQTAGDVAQLGAALFAPGGAKKGAEAAGRLAGRLENTALGRMAGDASTADFGNALRSIGGAVEQSGIKSADAARNEFVRDLILPKATPSVREDLVGRTTEKGLNRRQVVELTPQEQEIASTVASIPGVKKSNSLLGNANAVQNANRAEADTLIQNLAKNDVAIADDIITDGLTAVRNSLAKNPYVAGADASKAADRVVNQALELILEQPRTASGLLQARKNLDAWVKSQKPNVFDAADSPVSTAVREVRQGINNIVDAAVPDVAVKESLRKQSNLYRAHEAIATKAKDEAPTRLGRAAQAVSKGVSMKQGILGAGALAGIGATGLAGPLATAAVPALAIYGAKKAITSPALRTKTGSALRKLGESL